MLLHGEEKADFFFFTVGLDITTASILVELHILAHTCKNTLLLGCWQFFFFFSISSPFASIELRSSIIVIVVVVGLSGVPFYGRSSESAQHTLFTIEKSTGNIKIKFLYLQWINEWFPPPYVMVFALYIVSLMYAWSQYLHIL